MCNHPSIIPLAAAITCTLLTAVLAGCRTAAPDPTISELDAIEVREIDASRDRVLRAAASVLLDQGYAYTMSDHASGLISGLRLRHDPINAEYYARGGGMRTITDGCAHCAAHPACVHHSSRSAFCDSISVWVRPTDRARSLVRIQIWSGGAWIRSGPNVTLFAADIEQRLFADPASGPVRQASGALR
jgi:hypothetical protein